MVASLALSLWAAAEIHEQTQDAANTAANLIPLGFMTNPPLQVLALGGSPLGPGLAGIDILTEIPCGKPLSGRYVPMSTSAATGDSAHQPAPTIHQARPPKAAEAQRPRSVWLLRPQLDTDGASGGKSLRLVDDHPGEHVGLQHDEPADEAGERDRVKEDVAQDRAFMAEPVGRGR